uniref:THUMP domain containing 3 n=1 Tax=Latimeria chalumnae TaxID=7897 RepID=H3BH06_LATCH
MSQADQEVSRPPPRNIPDAAAHSKIPESDPILDLKTKVFTIGATVPTGFEQMAAEEVKEKIGSDSRISKDRGKIYFEIHSDSLPLVHQLKSVDNLFVVVEEFHDYQFKETKEADLDDFMQLPTELSWTVPLEIWKLNNNLKKKRLCRKKCNKPGGNGEEKPGDTAEEVGADQLDTHAESLATRTLTEVQEHETREGVSPESEQVAAEDAEQEGGGGDDDNGCKDEEQAELIKFRVTCNRAGDKHNFTSNDAARDFGGAVQDLFKWKADMTKFDIEVLLNIHDNEVVVGIALTEESLHRRNITHFGPTTLRSTLAYGMLRLCKALPTDIIIDPMCGTGAIPIEGTMEWPGCYFIAGDNHELAVNRTTNNIGSILKKRRNKGSTAWGLPLDVVQWDICNLPLKTGFVDVIVTDMPFGKRMGSRKKNWDLYPACLEEMGRVCKPETGRAALLTQDKKCFTKALFKMAKLWRKSHTVWVNVGGLHAAVYLLRRTAFSFNRSAAENADNKEPS